MNKLIRQFERDSGLEIYGLGARREMWEHCMEKFTLLIIKKCRDIVSDTRDQAIADEWNVDEAMSTAMFDIEEHFVVEE